MHLRFLLLLCVAVFLAACGGKETGPKEAAAEFFQRCANGQTEAAYQSASQVFKLERTQKYFEARVRDLALDKVQSAQWSEPQEKAGTQHVLGRFTVDGGKELQLNVQLARENGAWRILEVTRPPEKNGKSRPEDVFAVLARSQDSEAERTKAIVDPVTTAMPTARQLQQLVEKTLMDFNESIKTGNFDDFFAQVSDRWKYRGKDPRALGYAGTDPRRLEESDPENKAGRLTVSALRAAFAPFVAAKVDLSPLKGKTMVLEEPAHITSDAVLTMKGYYDEYVFEPGFPPQPRRLTFKLEYVFEGSSWRLFGITAHLVKPESIGGKK
jgi:hypothetical protein